MVEYRTYAPGLMPSIVEVWNASRIETPLFTPDTVEAFEVIMARGPDFNPGSVFIAFEGQRPVGFVEALVQRKRVEAGKSQGWITAEVVPELRGQGIERELMAKGLTRLKELGIKEAIYWFHPVIPWRLALAKESGFEHMRTYCAMEVPLGDAIPPANYPQGYTAERHLATEAARDFVVEWARAKDESFVDHFNSAPSDPEDFWLNREIKDEVLQYILVRDTYGKPAGVCMSAIEHVGNEDDAWISILGVLPGHRRKGIGRALLADGLGWLRTIGAVKARLGVDSLNDKSLPLYRSVGFQIVSRSEAWKKSL